MRGYGSISFKAAGAFLLILAIAGGPWTALGESPPPHLLGYDSVEEWDQPSLYWAYTDERQTYLSAMNYATAAWEAVGDVVIYGVDPENPRIDLSIEEYDQDDGYGGIYFNEDAKIKLNRNFLEPLDEQWRRNTAAHELGHALGLDHHCEEDDPLLSVPRHANELATKWPDRPRAA